MARHLLQRVQEMLVHQDSYPRGLIYQREHGRQLMLLRPAE